MTAATTRLRHVISDTMSVRLTSALVGLHGIFILGDSLYDQLRIHRGSHINLAVVDVPLLIGVSLIYLSVLLKRRKRTAWQVTIAAYAFYLGLGVMDTLMRYDFRHVTAYTVTRSLLLPAVILYLLFRSESKFVVRSDSQSFRGAARFAVVILIITFIYGVAGFLIFDDADFHQEITLPSAIHYTVDRFDLTTSRPIIAYTKRAQLFVDSLSFVSVSAIGYVAISLFQPLRARFGTNQVADKQRIARLLEAYGGDSEDYFKLWPEDKHFLFSESGNAAVAYREYRGIMVCLGDPVGDANDFPTLFDQLREVCFGNDWQPAYVHVTDKYRSMYESRDFVLQKIGEEAVVNIARFMSDTSHSKYFRQISNKFKRQDYRCELLLPPHHDAIINRLRVISDEWLGHGNKAERGFAMGYFSEAYMQRCPIVVARDAAGTIQAFLNQLPAVFDKHEASYDLLRQASTSLGNSNDYLLMNFIQALHEQGYTRLNLGLCPLAGMKDSSEKTLINNVLGFAYANGDRFYSFSGLQRFKAKYDPEWRDRFIAYRGGLRGFSRSANALVRAMRVKR